MKTIKYFLIIAALFIQSFFSLQAQSTEGTEFWLTFGDNNDVLYFGLFPELQIRIATRENPAKGKIHFTMLEKDVDFNIGAWAVFNYGLNIQEINAVSNTIQGTGMYSVKITSDESITVYALNQFTNSTDATNVLPITALGTDYYQISYPPLNGFSDAYAVIATEDNTQVFHNGTPIAEGILNKGKVYYRKSSMDMTGAHITSTKPVAFFVLNQAVWMPANTLANDCFFQQLAPVNVWGKNFFVPVSHLTKDRVRILASQNNTTITQTDGTLITGTGGQAGYTINAGQFIELETYLSNNGCFIHSDKPVGVCTYLTSMMYNPPGTESDPSISWLPSIEQTAPDALISPFLPQGTTQLNKHFALIITPTSTKDETRVSVGGAAPTSLSGGEWKTNLGSGYSYYIKQLPNTSEVYHFTNPKGLFALGYGVGWRESYYYLSYSGMRDLDAAFYGNDIHFQDFKENPFCESLINFRAEIDGKGIEVDTVKWFVKAVEEIAERNNLEWNKTFSIGEYEIKMWVYFENGDTLSKTGTIVRINCNQEPAFYANNVLHTALKDTTFCNKNVNFHAEIDGLIPGKDHIKWYIDDGSGYAEEVAAQDQLTWNKQFPTGNYEIKMEVLYENGNTKILTGTLKMEVLWIKIKNVQY